AAIEISVIQAFAMTAEKASISASRVLKYAVLAYVAAWGVEKLTDLTLYKQREAELWAPVKSLMVQIKEWQTNSSTPLPVLLAQYVDAVQMLGYFYSFNLYFADNALFPVDGQITPNPICSSQLMAYSAG